VTYSKQDFFRELDEIIAEPIFVGDSVDDLKEEINVNMWWIGATAEVLETLSVNEILDFIVQLTDNRREKMRQANTDHGMYFYLWFDDQAGQLRFNLISDFHTDLPFGATLNIIDTPVAIVGDFLTQYVAPSPRPDPYVLDVFMAHLI